MNTPSARSVLAHSVISTALSFALTACESSPGISTPSVSATCTSTCERSVALGCPNESYKEQDTCVSQCEAQVASCVDATIVAAYLDCIQTTPMECGSTLGTASSPECVQTGLAFFACTKGVQPGADATSSGDGAGADTAGDTAAPTKPDLPTAALGQFIANISRNGESLQLSCTTATAAKLQFDGRVFTPGGAGAQPVAVVSAFCQTKEKRNDRDVRAAELVLTIPSLDVGAYAIASEPPAAVSEKFRFDWRTDGSGWLFDGNKVASETYEGTVTIVENGGPAGTMRVRLEATWNQGRPFVDNVVGEPDGIPGAVAAEWAFTLP